MRQWVSDASFEAEAGLYMETGVFWRYELLEEQKARTVRRRKIDSFARLSMPINVLEVLGVVIAYVMAIIRGDGPEREGESGMIKGKTCRQCFEYNSVVGVGTRSVWAG